YENNQGQKVFTTDIAVNNITFVERKNNGQSNNQQQRQTQTGNNPFDNNADSIEDLPF
ncbi:single-stranded DNA-binding protein, partial [Staphylococcus aureus]